MSNNLSFLRVRKFGTFTLIIFAAEMRSAYAASPLNYLRGNGDKAYPVVSLTWGVLGISVAVIVVITFLVVAAIWRRPGISPPATGEKLQLERPDSGLGWIWVGLGLTTVTLLVSIVWTVMVLRTVRMPQSNNPLTIEVTGHQWWWEVRYLNDDPAQIFRTANEIHIPTGIPVFFKLKSEDVIHSFWVPALAGKTDVIPGLANETWMEAHDPGIYTGQCTEYCGLQHAHMGLLVIAQTPVEFESWREHQLQSPVLSASGKISSGATDFRIHCGSCHAIRGTGAAGALGPDLSHLMQRKTLAAGVFPNNAGNLTQWISDPQAVKPGSLMPKPDVSPTELADIRAYLVSLQ